MADEKKSPRKDEQVPDLAEKQISKEDSEKVKGGRAWDIPAGNATPGG